MAFVLNTTSGFLHDEDHGDGEKFDRADAADLHARSLGMKMQHCKTCFGENRNTLEAERLQAMEEAMLKGEPRPNEELLAPERVTLEHPQGTINADLAASAPATLPDRPTPQPTPRASQTER